MPVKILSSDWTIKELASWFVEKYPDFGLQILRIKQSEYGANLVFNVYDKLNDCVATSMTTLDPQLDDVKATIDWSIKNRQDQEEILNIHAGNGIWTLAESIGVRKFVDKTGLVVLFNADGNKMFGPATEEQARINTQNLLAHIRQEDKKNG